MGKFQPATARMYGLQSRIAVFYVGCCQIHNYKYGFKTEKEEVLMLYELAEGLFKEVEFGPEFLIQLIILYFLFQFLQWTFEVVRGVK